MTEEQKKNPITKIQTTAGGEDAEFDLGTTFDNVYLNSDFSLQDFYEHYKNFLENGTFVMYSHNEPKSGRVKLWYETSWEDIKFKYAIQARVEPLRPNEWSVPFFNFRGYVTSDFESPERGKINNFYELDKATKTEFFKYFVVYDTQDHSEKFELDMSMKIFEPEYFPDYSTCDSWDFSDFHGAGEYIKESESRNFLLKINFIELN